MKAKFISFGSSKFLAALLVLLLSTPLFAQTNVFDDVIKTSPNHTYLTAALQQEGLDLVLQDPNGTFTVFAPTDAAFDNLATALGTNIAGLLALPNLDDVLLYHVLGATVPSSGVTNGAVVAPVSPTNTLKLTKTTLGDVFVNQAEVIAFDLNADNGVVHVLDAVVLPAETVVDVALDNGFTTLATAVIQAELLPALTDPLAQYTVFAPTNAAFDNLATALGTNIAGLLALPNLKDVLLYHALGSEVPASGVTNGAVVAPLSTTNTLKLTKTSTGNVFVNQAQVTTADVFADNGVVHVLNAVVLPVETVVDVALDNGFTTLATAVIQEELLPALTDPLASYTVFAPTNAAFDNLATALGTNIAGLLALPNLTDVLTYHVLGSEVAAAGVTNGAVVAPLSSTNTLKLTKKSTGDVFVNQAKVTTADVFADNGVVHVLDAVVLPVETVVDIALDNGFTTLATAVIQEELLPALTNPLASYTVFAPTNTAFDNLATALGTNIAGLLALPNLESILLYHVIGTELLSGSLMNGPVTTLNGQTVNVTVSGGVKINNSNVTTPDLLSDNGVVHVIDAVLVPTGVGINPETKIEALSLFPNPATQTLTLGTNVDKGIYEIFDVYGKKVLSASMTTNAIDVSELAAGSYLIRLLNDEKIAQGKFVKF